MTVSTPRKERLLRGLRRLCLALACCCFSTCIIAADLEGRWLTLDSDSGAKRSIVVIAYVNDTFRGRIVELFSRPGESSDPICDECSGAEHGKKIIGMEILLVNPASDGSYVGKVLDPEEGRFYKCIVTLDVSRKHLSIRGYVGTPLIGRTVVWERVK